MKFSSLSIAGVQIIVFRDDLNHATISGNKLHKLAPNVELAKARKCSTILSFGGPYPNHLHALAWACKESGLKSIGIIRGELHSSLTPTLDDCKSWGMRLIPSSRKDYREHQEILSLAVEPYLASELALAHLSDDAQNTLVIPEGGSNTLAIDSLSNAYREIFESPNYQNVTHAICATGTGATLAGLYKASPRTLKIVGIQAVAEQGATLQRIHRWLDETPSNLTIEQGHLGGFGKTPVELLKFVEKFETTFKLPLDLMYNGKAMLKISRMIDAGYFKKTDKVLFINTGGLQGKRKNTV